MQSPDAKFQQWQQFSERVQTLLRGRRKALKKLSADELASLINDYQNIAADLARARSLGADQGTVDRLNRIAVAGHNLLYGYMRKPSQAKPRDGLVRFAREVRNHAWPVMLSIAMFFGSAMISYVAVQSNPSLGYDLLAEGFIDFDPAHQENLHEIPSLARPIVSSSIITNNIQVTLLVFGLGLTAGIGTTVLLIFNGIHLGSVAGWLTLQGKERALWGWIMPHGGTELLAICLAGAAGYMLAGAILMPGQLRRSAALARVGGAALTIELGCMVMLVIAGFIEGFVSPSGIDYTTRIAVLGLSLSLWATYFLGAGFRHESAPATESARDQDAAD